MIKLMRFPLRHNLNIKEKANEDLKDTQYIINIEQLGIDKDRVWCLVQIQDNSRDAFDSQSVSVKPGEFKEKTFNDESTFGGGD